MALSLSDAFDTEKSIIWRVGLFFGNPFQCVRSNKAVHVREGTVIVVLFGIGLGCGHLRQANMEKSQLSPPLTVEHEVIIAPREVVKDTIMRQKSQLTHCYDKQLKRRNDVSGRLVVSFRIDDNGAIRELSAEEDTLNCPSMTKCILNVFEGLAFPSGLKSDIVTPLGPFEEPKTGYEVVFPMVFSAQ